MSATRCQRDATHAMYVAAGTITLCRRHAEQVAAALADNPVVVVGRCIEVEVEAAGGRDGERWRLAKDSKGSSVASVAVANAFYGEVKR